MGIVSLAAGFVLLGCHSSSTNRPDAAPDSPAGKRPALPMFKRNPEFREHVSREPVVEYKVKTDAKLNDMYFIVQLYETKETMKYRARVEFEGLEGDDTVKLPDMGTPPKPVLQKGPEQYSCIIGLMDNHNRFRELKKVYVTDKGRQLKITRLKRYMVTEDYRLEGE
jgi:hypothetical protein